MRHNQCVLVTGGAGFVGSHSVELILSKGYQVKVVDNLSTGSLSNLPQHKQLEFYNTDICNYDELIKAAKGITHILHLAAIVSVPKSILNPTESFATNVEGFINILRITKEAKNKIRLVYASSAAVYGNTSKIPCNEEDCLHTPTSPYALDKLTNEYYANLYHRLYDISSIGLRYFNIYGPRQDANNPYSGVISKFIDSYKNNSPLFIYGDGKQTRDFIYVKDIAYANLLALESNYSGVINIATGIQSTLLKLNKILAKISNKNLSPKFDKPRVGDLKYSYANTEKALEKIKFKAMTSLDEGLKNYLNEIPS